MAGLTPDVLLELKRSFAAEIRNLLPAVTGSHARLSNDSTDLTAVKELQSLFHKIRGTAASVGFAEAGRTAAVCEGVTNLITKGDLDVSPAVCVIFREGINAVEAILTSVESGANGHDTPAPIDANIEFAGTDPDTTNILVIDDDPISGALLTEPLREAGFQAYHCSDPTEAVTVANDQNPDLIILDVMMPTIDGFEVCRRLRAESAMELTPIIFVTAHDDIEHRVRGLEVGGNDYIVKPVQPRELIARTRSHLHRLGALRELAIRDGLTRCFSRRYFDQRIDQEIARCLRYDHPAALVLIDLDHFKTVNDTHGHPIGDQVLLHVANSLNGAVRSSDVVARYGGDEFAVLLMEAAIPEAELICERFRSRVATHPVPITPDTSGSDDIGLTITITVGAAILGPGDTPALLMERADRALYAAKEAGRNTTRVMAGPQRTDLPSPSASRR